MVGRCRPPVGLGLVASWLHFLFFLLPNIIYAILRGFLPPKTKSLDGKVVLVTGAGGGVGRSLALHLSRCGCRVACVDSDRAGLLDTVADILRDGEHAKAYFTDLKDPEELRELPTEVSKQLGPVDILVHSNRPLGDTAISAQDVMQHDFFTLVSLTQSTLPLMKERFRGHVVCVSSMAAHLPVPGAALHVAAQCAATGYMQSVRLETLQEGLNQIHFTTVHPPVMSASAFDRCSDEIAVQVVSALRTCDVTVCEQEARYYLSALTRFLPTSQSDTAHWLWSSGYNTSSPSDTREPSQSRSSATTKHHSS